MDTTKIDDDLVIDYELWRNNEMRDLMEVGKMSMEEFNAQPPFKLLEMYLEWNKKGRWSKQDK